VRRNIPADNLPGVSVIILTYNANKYIEDLLQSLSGQSYPADKTEILVVDNASVDNTVALAQKWGHKVRCIALDSNLGFTGGNNAAVNYASHDFMVFLNQDTICHKDWLKGLVESMYGNDRIGAATSNMLLPGTKEAECFSTKTKTDSLYFYDLSVFGYGKYCHIKNEDCVYPKIISGSSFAIRRRTINDLGYLFDEDLRMYAEDTDLSLRLYNRGLKLIAVKDSVVYHLHNVNISITKARLRILQQAIMNRVFVFFKNMAGLEFILYLPFILIGGIFKIMNFRMKSYQKLALFLPFCVFSSGCMILALFKLPRFAVKRRAILISRTVKRLPVLRLVLNGVLKVCH